MEFSLTVNSDNLFGRDGKYENQGKFPNKYDEIRLVLPETFYHLNFIQDYKNK